MTENALTASRESALLTLLRDERPWEEKRDEVIGFAFKPVERSDGPNDDLPPADAPDSWDEFSAARAAGLVTPEQYDEVADALEAKAGDAPDAAAAKQDPPPAASIADRDPEDD